MSQDYGHGIAYKPGSIKDLMDELKTAKTVLRTQEHPYCPVVELEEILKRSPGWDHGFSTRDLDKFYKILYSFRKTK